MYAAGVEAVQHRGKTGKGSKTMMDVLIPVAERWNELVRHQSVEAQQDSLFGEVWLIPGSEPEAAIDAQTIDSYEHRRQRGGNAK